MKNIQQDETYSKAIDYTIPSQLDFQKDKNGEVHFDILENIVFPPGSISNVFFILGEWISDFKIRTKKKNSIQ